LQQENNLSSLVLGYSYCYRIL